MKKWIAIALLSMPLAACNTNDKDDLDEEAADLITPYDNDNGEIEGVNDGTNGSDRGLFMNGDEANVESPTSNKDTGSTSNGGNDMNGAGGTNGESGNNAINEGAYDDVGGTSGTGEGVPDVKNEEDIVEDKIDRKDTDRVDE